MKVYRLITRNSYEREMFDKASLKLGLDKAVLQDINRKGSTNGVGWLPEWGWAGGCVGGCFSFPCISSLYCLCERGRRAGPCLQVGIKASGHHLGSNHTAFCSNWYCHKDTGPLPGDVGQYLRVSCSPTKS